MMKYIKNDTVKLINGKTGRVIKAGTFQGGASGYMVKSTDDIMYLVNNKEIFSLIKRAD